MTDAYFITHSILLPSSLLLHRSPMRATLTVEVKAMPYSSRAELPESVKHVLPPHAQDIYKEAFNSAYDEYKDPEDRRDDSSREEVAHKVAWAAVKQTYEKDEESGTWVSKEGTKVP
jgi:cation transport regulator